MDGYNNQLERVYFHGGIVARGPIAATLPFVYFKAFCCFLSQTTRAIHCLDHVRPRAQIKFLNSQRLLRYGQLNLMLGQRAKIVKNE